jgi:hypothetical protein
MGYTHYYRNKRAFTDSEWAALIADVKKLLADTDIPIGNAYGDVGSKPHFGKDVIRFNGIGDDSHETAAVHKSAANFWFCKTSHKPYDKVVVEFYKLIRKYDPDVKLSSDGGDEIFAESSLNKVTIVVKSGIVSMVTSKENIDVEVIDLDNQDDVDQEALDAANAIEAAVDRGELFQVY